MTLTRAESLFKYIQFSLIHLFSIDIGRFDFDLIEIRTGNLEDIAVEYDEVSTVAGGEDAGVGET